MLTLLFAYGAYRNARQANRALRLPEGPEDTVRGIVLVSYGLMLFFLWPLVIPAAILRYVPTGNPFAAFLPVLPLLASLPFIGLEFYFVYSLLVLVAGLNFAITALVDMENQKQEKSSSNV